MPAAHATIAAVATGPARGGISVVRVSGPLALGCTLALVRSVPRAPTPRHAYFTEVLDRAGSRLDAGLFLYFAGPHSFTGEDVVELQLHGSPALATLVLREVLAGGDARAAEPGEFTRRAFLNGRIDLLAAEAVADLVEAESEAMVRAAAAQLTGQVSARVREAAAALEDVAADVEGILDFPDEAVEAEAGVPAKLALARERVAALQDEAARAERLRRAGRVVLCGPPNAGKSTLFNALLGTERALVDEAPGTTRDVLEAGLELGGLPLTLVDTAGQRDGQGVSRVEAEGIARARAAVEGADLALLVLPATEGDLRLEGWPVPRAGPQARLVVRAKADLAPREGDGLFVSARTGEGMGELRAALLERLGGAGGALARTAFSSRAQEALDRSAAFLASAQRALEASTLEVVAGEVALAREALDAVTGESSRTAVLDAVFRRFCIGK